MFAEGTLISANSEDHLAEEERLAEEVYDRLVCPTLKPEDDGKYVAVAFEEGDFEVDPDDFAATERILARRPGARLWLMRVGKLPAYRVRELATGQL